MQNLEGKIAVITGGGSGIGRGMARAFARAGMHVVVADVDLEAATQVAAELNGTAIKADVTQAEEVDALAAQVFGRLGAVHVLCLNAGVTVGGALSDMTRDDWRWVLGVNLYGTVNCITAFVPVMRKQKDEAHIVSTASILGLAAVPERGVYGATKAAIISISETLHAELKDDGIGVTVVCPGSVRTRITEASRNRPKDLGETRVAPPTVFSDPVGTIDPDQLGQDVLDAVLANKLYVVALTEGNRIFVPMIEKRFDAILQAIS